MSNIIDVKYSQTGESTKINNMGMRDMQARAFEARNNQYILLKAPPASGKSRALMFLGLDKLHNQGLKKVIVAVPERSIGGSFSSTKLTLDGFFADWTVKPENNLCSIGGEESKVTKLISFLSGTDDILVCTHSTLRYACEKISPESFNNVLLAIDEFHHVSIDEDSKLGRLLRNIMDKSTAHIVAMTGSYFRGDNLAILLPEDEERFSKVTYNYYEQLNGYEFLKSLGIGYHFYQGRYTSAIGKVLDTDKKTILHIPNVNSQESTKDKLNEVDLIIDTFGEISHQEADTGVWVVKRKKDGKLIRVADLVNDEPKERERIVNYLRNIKKLEDLDLIIALGMAKEGFDWAYCEHALTVGYRGSLTEVIQIIGRCTRDSSNKSHAQFTNLLAEPDAKSGEVADAVNNLLKAITASLLMEQVLAPQYNFKIRQPNEPKVKGTINILNVSKPKTELGQAMLKNEINELMAKILSNNEFKKALVGLSAPGFVRQHLIPNIIREMHPDLDEGDVQAIAQHAHIKSVLPSLPTKTEGNQQFIQMAGKFIKVEDLEIDLIESINSFQGAYEILSKAVDKEVLKAIQLAIVLKSTNMSLEEAKSLWPKIEEFVEVNQREPDANSSNAMEVLLARGLAYLRKIQADL
jgi:hypothetical protein